MDQKKQVHFTDCRVNCRHKGDVAIGGLARVGLVARNGQRIPGNEQVQAAQAEIADLKRQLLERDSAAAASHNTAKLLRGQVADLEKHNFVLTHRLQVAPCPFWLLELASSLMSHVEI